MLVDILAIVNSAAINMVGKYLFNIMSSITLALYPVAMCEYPLLVIIINCDRWKQISGH